MVSNFLKLFFSVVCTTLCLLSMRETLKMCSPPFSKTASFSPCLFRSHPAASENVPGFVMSAAEPLPGPCCYSSQPPAFSFSSEGWGRYLRESVRWRNGWDSTPCASVVPLLVPLTPEDRALDTQKESHSRSLVSFVALNSKLKKP